MKPLTIPFKHQREGSAKVDLWNGRALIADDPGLGKSLTSLMWAIKRMSQLPAVVICPASLKWNWEREIQVHTGLESVILEGTTPRRLTKTTFVIVNYDILHKWLDSILVLQPQTLIVDECHYIKNLKARRSKVVKKLARKTPHVLALSGTPLTNRPAELFATLNLIRPDIYRSFFMFASEFCRLQKTNWGWVYDGARNLDKLHRELSEDLMIRRRKEDILDLPSKIRSIIPVPLESYKEYRSEINEYQKWLKIRMSGQKGNMGTAEMQKQAHILRVTASQKIPAVCEWIDNFLESSDQKLIVFGRHRAILKHLNDHYGKISTLVNGSIVGVERENRFQQFNQNKKVRLLFGNIQAAGTGWSCSSASSVAFIELPYTPGELVQAEDRCHGMGRGIKGTTTTIYYLLGQGTIEEKLCERLQNKQRILSMTLDGDVQDTDLNIHTLLRELLTEKTNDI